MNAAQLHLLLNHVPVLGVVFGLLLFLLALILKSKEIRTAAYVLLVIAALITIPVYLSGEPAEEIVEDMPGVTEHIIEDHEASALYALIGVELLGLLSLGGLVLNLRSDSKEKVVVYSTFVLGLVVFAIFYQTAHLGGQIHHQELQPDIVVNVENSDDDD